jgi:hypothetical protein
MIIQDKANKINMVIIIKTTIDPNSITDSFRKECAVIVGSLVAL